MFKNHRLLIILSTLIIFLPSISQTAPQKQQNKYTSNNKAKQLNKKKKAKLKKTKKQKNLKEKKEVK